MSTATPTRLAQSALSAVTTTTLYTAVSKVIVKEIWLSNTSAAAVPVTLAAGPGTGVAQSVCPGMTVPAKGVLALEMSRVLEPGDVISGGAGTAGVVGVTISGVTVV